VEGDGTLDPDLAAIKAQPESTYPQQPESPPISMPPKTRSQTARSRPPNSPSLATLEEELRNLDVEDDGRRPAQPPSPDYDPADCRREAEGLETHTTPKVRKKTRTVTSSQRDLARSADPNGGRCLITNRPEPVQSYHLVAQATDHETVRFHVSQIMRLYSLRPTRSSRNWSMFGGLDIDISTSTRGIT